MPGKYLLFLSLVSVIAVNPIGLELSSVKHKNDIAKVVCSSVQALHSQTHRIARVERDLWT